MNKVYVVMYDTNLIDCYTSKEDADEAQKRWRDHYESNGSFRPVWVGNLEVHKDFDHIPDPFDYLN